MKTPLQLRYLAPALLGAVLFTGIVSRTTAAARGQGDASSGSDVEGDGLRPGLVALYRSATDAKAVLRRIDAKPAFTLGHSGPHPRLPPGAFEVVWTGVLLLQESAPITFDAALCGEVTVEVDGVAVLAGRGERETARVGPGKPLERRPGRYPLKVRYRSLPDLPARLQIGWQGPTFAREPLPAWRLQHLTGEETEDVTRDLRAEDGREAVGRLGCARCHRAALPGVTDAPPGPSLGDVKGRITREWLLDWLADPARLRPNTRMPALFPPGRAGFVERWLVAEHLLGASPPRPRGGEPSGDHRMGRRLFVGVGCTACHLLPDVDRAEQPDLGRTPLTGLKERLPADYLTAFLGNPHGRYPDGRMPRQPIAPGAARDLAAYLLEWAGSVPAPAGAPGDAPPTAEEIRVVTRRLRVRGAADAAAALVREKGCAACHVGLGHGTPADVPLTTTDLARGCLSGRSLPRFSLDAPTRRAVAAYLTVAPAEKHPSPFASRQRLLGHLGCVRCHQRDSDRPSPLETAGSTLGGAWLQNVPSQRAPRLSSPHQKYTASHLLSAVREGVSGLRGARSTYLMPAFGHDAEAVVQALAEADGDLPGGPEPPAPLPADPTLATLAGPQLTGFQGYACVSCHVWNGQALSEPDPGAVGTDLTRVAGRLRRDWFDRYLEGPARSHPGTPMPSIFERGKPATLVSVLDGDAARQKDALWAYFALGKAAPGPKPPPPLPVGAPAPGETPLVAQIPVRLPDGKLVESICLLNASHDLVVYDVGAADLHGAYTGAQILRGFQGRLRTYGVAGVPVGTGFRAEAAPRLVGPGEPEVLEATTLHGYDRLADGVRVRWQARFPSGTVEVAETLRLGAGGTNRRLKRELRFTGVPAGRAVEVRARGADRTAASSDTAVSLRYELLPAAPPPAYERALLPDPGTSEGSPERPGYRAVAYPRPKTVSGEDLVMPGALAVDPRDGRVFVASLKTGTLFVLRDPTDDGRAARFEDYAGGLFQEAFSMLAEPGALYVLHRRNLTRLTDADGDGRADRFDRVAALPHGVADTYDYGYGLARDRGGAFVFSYAPYASRHLPGSGGALRLVPGREPEEVAFGMRNPLGWCAGPDGVVFFTDNQGEWVATNKLCHLEEGRYYGFPNPEQRHHAGKPPAKTTVWVPYAWAKSINGVAYDNSGGKFGPFAGQLFLAELMFGGAIIRADVEKVNGVYQGACFPFWGRGLLGPLTLAFDPRGRLFVGGVTEPGWMAQPDRGALFRLDYTGETPFEIRSIRVLPQGFRVLFTRPASAGTAGKAASYRVESYRYEYTGAYGSPELDRTPLAVERVELSADGLSADLIAAPLVKDRVYMIHAGGVRSAKGEALVHPAGAYTLNEIPPRRP